MFDLFRDGHRKLRDFNLTSVVLLIFIQILLIVLPIIEVVLWKSSNALDIALISIYIIHFIVAFISLYALQKIKDLIEVIKIDDLEQALNSEIVKSEAAREIYTTQAAQSVAIQWSLSVLHSLLQKEECVGIQEEEIKALLEPLIQGRSQALGYVETDFYNIAVYEFDEEENILKLKFRSCDNRITTHNRNWKPGVGHIGITFAQNRTIINSELTNAEELLDLDHNETDKKYYASFASVPIQDIDSSAQDPAGVFVITSSRSGHLGQEHKIFVETYSLILSIYFSACIIKTRGSVQNGTEQQPQEA